MVEVLTPGKPSGVRRRVRRRVVSLLSHSTYRQCGRWQHKQGYSYREQTYRVPLFPWPLLLSCRTWPRARRPHA